MGLVVFKELNLISHAIVVSSQVTAAGSCISATTYSKKSSKSERDVQEAGATVL